jgi:toxin-antitoxin system PIN domain toxin
VIVPDVNVLIPLHRPGHVHHQRAQEWWQEFASRGEPLTVPDVIWSGFVRVATHPRILRPPSSVEEAWQFVNAVRALGIYIPYASHPRLMDLFAAQCQEASATANLVTDAYIAAGAIALGATVVTFDRDFRRFDGLSVLELS